MLSTRDRLDGFIAERIINTYRELATYDAEWIRLADLRPLLGEMPHDDVSRVMVDMQARKPRVILVPDADQRAVTDADRAAGIPVGSEVKHLIAIEF